jgi:hypothetical protein
MHWMTVSFWGVLGRTLSFAFSCLGLSLSQPGHDFPSLISPAGTMYEGSWMDGKKHGKNFDLSAV